MPIYEYRCPKGHTFEVLQSFSDDPVTVCEEHGAPVARIYRAPAVHFKGSGFYNTDYGTRKRSRELKESAENGSKSEGSKDKSKSSSSDSSSTTSDSGKSSDSTKKAESKAS
jgi:putative FmdB family regulatory protein